MPSTLASDAYMEAFMSGFEFVLLAIRGRLAEGNVPPAERQRLEAFLADYWRISASYHARQPAPAAEGLVVAAFVADLPEQAVN